MSNKKRKCPFCKQKFNGGSPHIYKCKKRPLNKTKDEIKFEFYKYNFPKISNKEILYKEYIIKKHSLPELRKKFKLDFKAILWLITYFNIKQRNLSEGSLLGVEKRKKYYKKNFNVENCSQTDEVKEKKKKTFLKHYGVDNIRKWKPFYDYIDKVIQEKYGISKSKLLSIKGKEFWEKLTDKQKEERLRKSMLSDEGQQKAHQNKKGYNSSKLETRIEEILKENNITYTSQFIIKKNKKRRFYDFYLNEYKIIIEVNGDYWHANPKIYKPNDIIHYCFGMKKAKEIWKRDEEKRLIAENKGYKVIYIWEKELNELKNNKKILEHLKLNYEN